MSKWISINDRLPEIKLGVLVYCPERNNIYAAYLADFGEWYFFTTNPHMITEAVTFWMPMPEPPEEELINDQLCNIGKQIMDLSSKLHSMSGSLDNIVGDLSEIVDGARED